MTTPLKQRIKEWICKHFGHKGAFSHFFGKNYCSCHRCGRIYAKLKEQENEI